MPTFQYNCISSYDETELTYIIEHMQPITLEAFQNSVNQTDYEMLIQGLGYMPEFTIDKDWHVNYAKCFLPRKHKTAYILIHSCIEYIFY